MDYLLQGLINAFRLLLAGDPETFSAVWTTLRASSLSIGASLVLGAPFGFVLGRYRFPGRKLVRLVVDTLLSFPTVVIGLLVYAFLTYRGPLGEMGLLFTVPGICIGQTILGAPIVAAMTAVGVESLDERLEPTLKTLGAGPWRRLATTFLEARYSLLLAAVAAYGRIVSEVGISMMVGGNIKWHTRTITTAIALETNKGQFAMGVALGVVLLLIAFVVSFAAHALRNLSEN
jgi:tungstate transport system permease protein